MKKYFSYALVGAIALTGAVGISSCSSSSDEVVPNNPNISPQEEAVKTAKENENVARYLEGQQILKEIYVPNKLISFVVKPL